VLDTGIDSGHAAVGSVNGYLAVSGEGDALSFETSPHPDATGHGTACAGIIRSLAPECELYSVKVLGPDLTGRGANFAAGLRWAIDNGIQVCNLSVGTSRREFFGVLHELADRAYFKNVMLIAAASNKPMPTFPALFASVLSVASHAVREPHQFYYNPRPPVEFGALGIDVTVPALGGGFVTATGNSFAAPHITGIVAQILGKHPDLTVFEMKTILRALAANCYAPTVSGDAASAGRASSTASPTTASPDPAAVNTTPIP
jgi:subtilisin family serine protease